MIPLATGHLLAFTGKGCRWKKYLGVDSYVYRIGVPEQRALELCAIAVWSKAC